MSQIIQKLTVFLKGGQTIVLPFEAEKPDVLGAQLDAFLKALNDKNKADSNYLFTGARLVLVRLADVSGVDIVTLVRKENAEKEETKAPEAKTAEAK